ncbi:MAG: addiction module protein [Bacteroidota bacterium]
MSLMLDQILNLSVAERIMLVEAIWDSIPEEQSGAALSEETKQLLDQRLAAHRANPDSGSSWEEVKERIQEQL